MPKACVVPKCKSGTRFLEQKCSVFKVPKNIERFKQWQTAIPGVVLKQTHHVCEKHFTENCIIRQWIKRDANGEIIAQTAYERPRLLECALPTLFEDSKAVQSTTPAHFDSKDEPADFFMSNTAQSFEFCDVSMQVPTSMDVAKAEAGQTLSRDMSQKGLFEDSVCPQTETNSPLEFSQQSDSASLGEIHLDHDYVQPVIISHEISIKEEIPNMMACSTVPTRCRNFGMSNIQMNDGNIVVTSVTKGKSSITIPKYWGCKDLLTERGHSIIFSHLELKRGNGAEIPVIERSITIDPDNRLRYSLCGHAVDLDKCKLAEVLENTSLLPVILDKFQKMKPCSGLGVVNTHNLLADMVIKDSFDRWRDNDCTLLSKKKRCEECKKMRQRLLRREVRSRENRTTNRMLRASNPVDEKKLLALRKKKRSRETVKISSKTTRAVLERKS